MISVALRDGADLEGFRGAVRRLVACQAAPHSVVWETGDAPGLLGQVAAAEEAPAIALPRALAAMIEPVVCHRDRQRYAWLYEAVWRVLHGERGLLEIASDPLVHRLAMLQKSVRRDRHKMTAFVRFRETTDSDGGERYVAWFEPEHHIVEHVAPFFVERFQSLVWSILTPDGSLHWDRTSLVVGPPGRRSDLPETDNFEAAWRCYYENIFNPARVNPTAMRSHMAKKYWQNLPEAASIPQLVRDAPRRAREMIARGAAPSVRRDPLKAIAAMGHQEPRTLEELNRQIAASEPLTPGADRAVLGEGMIGADIAFVGEQPGDQEDREGRPFIGPAGQLLDQVLREVGIDRTRVYVTNAVKHFKFEPRGGRRLHKRPNRGEVKRYRWWLHKELAFVRPRLVVALGSTAVLGLTGEAVPLNRVRGARRLEGFDGYVTVHPAYLLRLPDAAAQQEAYEAFRSDLAHVRTLVAA
ncbi:UdgX family uracil-DNA binding protein [soil metagenome]